MTGPGPFEPERHGDRDCAELLERFLLEPQELRACLASAVSPQDDGRAIVERLGDVLWDVFSNNHTVTDSEGRPYDLGSFRGSAGFIAEVLNRRYPGLGGWGYLDFYMGSLGADRDELRHVYAWIFRGLAAAGCQWTYAFPRPYLVDFRDPASGIEDELKYDPGEVVRQDIEGKGRTESLAERFERYAEEDMRRARDEPLPAIVAAYRDVFGRLPEGWPHPEM